MFREKSKNNLRRGAALVLAGLLTAGALGGCFGRKSKVGTAANASPTGYAWDGQYSGYAFHESVDLCLRKTNVALRRAGFMVKPDESNPGGQPALLVAYDKERNRAEVIIKRVTQKQTEVKVRVGTLGYRTASESVLEGIRVSIEEASKAREE